MTVTVRDVMPQETRLTIQAKNEDGTWRDLHQLELTRRFGDGAAFSSGSIGYNASGPLQLPDVVGNRVQHTLSCSITETGTKGMFAPKPDAKASGSGKAAKTAAARARYGLGNATDGDGE